MRTVITFAAWWYITDNGEHLSDGPLWASMFIAGTIIVAVLEDIQTII